MFLSFINLNCVVTQYGFIGPYDMTTEPLTESTSQKIFPTYSQKYKEEVAYKKQELDIFNECIEDLELRVSLRYNIYNFVKINKNQLLKDVSRKGGAVLDDLLSQLSCTQDFANLLKENFKLINSNEMCEPEFNNTPNDKFDIKFNNLNFSCRNKCDSFMHKYRFQIYNREYGELRKLTNISIFALFNYYDLHGRVKYYNYEFSVSVPKNYKAEDYIREQITSEFRTIKENHLAVNIIRLSQLSKSCNSKNEMSFADEIKLKGLKNGYFNRTGYRIYGGSACEHFGI